MYQTSYYPRFEAFDKPKIGPDCVQTYPGNLVKRLLSLEYELMDANLFLVHFWTTGFNRRTIHDYYSPCFLFETLECIPKRDGSCDLAIYVDNYHDDVEPEARHYKRTLCSCILS